MPFTQGRGLLVVAPKIPFDGMVKKESCNIVPLVSRVLPLANISTPESIISFIEDFSYEDCVYPLGVFFTSTDTILSDYDIRFCLNSKESCLTAHKHRRAKSMRLGIMIDENSYRLQRIDYGLSLYWTELLRLRPDDFIRFVRHSKKELKSSPRLLFHELVNLWVDAKNRILVKLSKRTPVIKSVKRKKWKNEEYPCAV